MKQLLTLAFVLLILGVVGTKDAEDQAAEERMYCDMVARHKADPSQGWPEYRKGEVECPNTN